MDRFGGGQFGPHLLTADGKKLLTCVGRAVRVYSARTGEHLFSLQHDEEVAAISLHPTYEHQVYAATTAGSLVLWELTTGVALHTVSVPIGVSSFVVAKGRAFLACSWRSGEAGRVLAYDLASGKPHEERGKVSAPRQLVVSRNGEWVATVDRHTVLLWQAGDFSRPALTLTHTKALTCVALSSDGERVAAGDTTGRIVLWHDVARAAQLAAEQQRDAGAGAGASAGAGDAGGEEEGEAEADAETEGDAAESPPATTVHWHAREVCCLTFSLDDSYLLSGGHEAVLVMWDVGGSGNRSYLPRLGGPLLGIACCSSDSAKYAIRQADNTLRVVNMATAQVECSVHGLRPAVPVLGPSGLVASIAPVALQPASGLLAVAGSHSVLQFYDMDRDVHVDKLQLSARNLGLLAAGPHDGSGAGPLEPAATQLAFSSDGSVLVTVERTCTDAILGPGSEVLKFWEQRLGRGYGSPYALVATAEEPHRSASGTASITGLAFHPADDVAVTTAGVEFRVWKREQIRAKQAAGATWLCQAIASYRDQPMRAPSFSGDGSLLAVAAGEVVTLWDTQQMACLGVIALPPRTSGPSQILRLAFLTDSHYLAAVTRDCLAIFDVLSFSVVGSMDLAVEALAVDPGSGHFAVVVNAAGANSPSEGKFAVVLFRGPSKQPHRAWLLQAAAGWAPPLQLAFVPSVCRQPVGQAEVATCSPLMVLSASREYVLLAMGQQQEAAPERQDGPGPVSLSVPDSTARFAAMYGTPGGPKAAGATAAAPAAVLAARPLLPFEDVPSHELPPVQDLCPDFLLKLLRSNLRD